MCIWGNILHPTVNPNPRNPHKERIPQYMRVNEDLLYKEIPSLLRNGCQLYVAIKISKPSQTKIRIIHPNSGTLELWKFSNLTFENYLASTTLVLFVGSFSSFCVLQVLSRAREDLVTYWRFSASSVGAVCEKVVNHTTTSRTKSCMVLTHSMVPPTTIKGTNHVPPPLRDNFRLS